MTEPTDRHLNEPMEPVEDRREPVFNLPPVVIAAIAICVAVHLVSVYVLDGAQYAELLWRGAFVPIRYSGAWPIDIYAFTTPVTYAFMHGGFVHLAINMVWLAAFGSPLANQLGIARFSLFWVITGLAAAGLHYIVHPLDQGPLVGASGAIAGMMGAAARFGFRIDRSAGRPAFAGNPLPITQVFRSRNVMTFLVVWMVINLVTGLIGFAPGVDDSIAWEAHVGGFLAGFLGIQYFDRKRARR